MDDTRGDVAKVVTSPEISSMLNDTVHSALAKTGKLRVSKRQTLVNIRTVISFALPSGELNSSQYFFLKIVDQIFNAELIVS